MSIPNGFKPTLAGTCSNISKLNYPVWVMPKLDGLRCVIFDGVAYSRTLKPFRNKFVQQWASDNAPYLEGFDGELIVGEPTAHDVFQKSTSGVMSEDGEPDFTFYAFDVVDTETDFRNRITDLAEVISLDNTPRTSVVLPIRADTPEELTAQEEKYLKQGYEGLMVRSLYGKYKFGRSTEKEGILLKVKRFIDNEFKIVGFEELLHNENEAQLDNFGRTERSSAKEGLVPAGTLGALILQYKDNMTFKVGTGFDAETRKYLWDNRLTIQGKYAKVKYFNVGMVDLPRFPVFVAIRDEIDFDKE